MKSFKGLIASFSLGALLLVASAPARAVFTINVLEVGANVVASGSGSINTTGLTPDVGGFTTTAWPYISGALGGITSHADGNRPLRQYSGVVSGPASFGTGATTFANGGAADTGGASLIYMNSLSTGGILAVDSAYVSGTNFTNGAQWTGASFATLGLTPGTYTFTWGSGVNADSLVLNIGPVAGSTPVTVPTLSEYVMMALASLLAMLGIAAMKRRRS